MPAKVLVVQALLRVVDVGVINKMKLCTAFLYLILTLLITNQLGIAAILPEERVDVLYHNYTGGGITVDGPSVLVRKNFADKVSISANYYVDNITSASIDAVTQASPYTEKRVQQSIGADYLNDKSTLSYSFTTSVESDFDATTHSFGISQEMFGSMTNVSLSYAVGDNIVTQTGVDSFLETSGFKQYRTSLSQVLTKNMIMSLNYDIITDEGFLNNPYRNIRYLDNSVPRGYSYRPEVYPETRTTNAASIGLRYFLPYRAAIYGSYRYFSDSWDIKADTFEIGYVHPLEENWTFETSLRYYTQTQASFYSDLFTVNNPDGPANVFGRDKEISTFTDYNIMLGVSYEFESDSLWIFERGSANLYYTFMSFDYANFNDLRVETTVPGDEPLYSLTAGVTRLFVSFWF